MKDPDDWDEDDNIFLYGLSIFVVLQIVVAIGLLLYAS